jgi:hypothetical protein
VALKVERVMDGSVHIEKALGRPGRLEPLHLALSSAHGLMGVFGAVALSNALLMRAGQAKVPEGRCVGAQLVGDQQFRRETVLPEQLAHQPERRVLVASALNQHIEDLALMIDSAPQVHPLAGYSDDHLVEVPSLARAWAGPPEPSCNPGPEFQHPAPHRFIGNPKPRSASRSSTSR